MSDLDSLLTLFSPKEQLILSEICGKMDKKTRVATVFLIAVKEGRI